MSISGSISVCGFNPRVFAQRYRSYSLISRQTLFAISAAFKICFKDQLEADIDSLRSHSSEPEVWDLASETPEEIAVWCAEYKCGLVTSDSWPCAVAWGLQAYIE